MQPTRFLRTIKVHKKNVKKKLDGEENREMAAWAFERLKTLRPQLEDTLPSATGKMLPFKKKSKYSKYYE